MKKCIASCSITTLIATVSLTSLAQEETSLPPVAVRAPKLIESTDSSLGVSVIQGEDLLSRWTSTSDSARLLLDIPGVSLYGAGGISSLPVIHGLADDRIHIEINGMGLMSACPNHMNPAMSYIDPSNIDNIKVFSGVSPVSVGGDSIGGTIQVTSKPPEFADPGEKPLVSAQAGMFFRSNGDARGGNLSASLASEYLSLSYNGSTTKAENYSAGKAFKAAEPGTEGGEPIPGDIVASTAYHANNQELGLAISHNNQLAQLIVAQQNVLFEGFPNQRMDMTANDDTQVNFRYSGKFDWGDLIARSYQQKTRHKMDMGSDRYQYGFGMPMNTKATTRGALLQGNLLLTDKDTLRAGVEYQNYTLYDWWPPVGGTMGPNAFWNIDYGQRDRVDLFTEWEVDWNLDWLTQLGVRRGTVKMDAGPVQGYDDTLAAIWGDEAAAFNALDRERTDHNLDMTAMVRYAPGERQSYELGYARKARSPNLYQRYTWSTQAMAALMNNFVGDGNGYIGNPDLKPEKADTFSVSGNWYDTERQRYDLKATLYYTRIRDYIDAERCDFGQCSAENVTTTSDFVLLRYVNQRARIYGLDLSGQLLLGTGTRYGRFTAKSVLNYVRGKNLTTGDSLYHIMPFNARLSLEQRLGTWTNTAEVELVAENNKTSSVRNEIPTEGYGLFHLRSRYEWQNVRIDLSIENVFDRFYSMPSGGAYVGQGASMTTNGIPWGSVVPGKGRSIDISLNFSF
jgi:iron complex outermembrane receptor protein